MSKQYYFVMTTVLRMFQLNWSYIEMDVVGSRGRNGFETAEDKKGQIALWTC